MISTKVLARKFLIITLFGLSFLLGKMMIEELSYRDIFNALTTLCAAFGGAWSAFRWQKHQNAQKERQHAIVSLQKALFAIDSQYNELIIIYRQHLKKEEREKTRHIQIIPFLNYSKIPELDFDSLSSIILEHNDPNIIFELMHAQNNYFSVLGMVEKRNEYHIKYQNLTSNLGSDAVDQLGLKGMTQKYPDILYGLETTTDEIYELHNDAIEKNRKSSEMLVKFISINFKELNPKIFIPLPEN